MSFNKIIIVGNLGLNPQQATSIIPTPVKFWDSKNVAKECLNPQQATSIIPTQTVMDQQ